MIVNDAFFDQIAQADNLTLTHMGEIAQTNRIAATDPRERHEFEKAELAIFLEMLGRVPVRERVRRRAAQIRHERSAIAV